MSLLELVLFMLSWLGAGVVVTYLLFEPLSGIEPEEPF